MKCEHWGEGHSHFSSSVWYVTGGSVWLTMSFVATAASTNEKSQAIRAPATASGSAATPIALVTDRAQTPVTSDVMRNCVATTLTRSFSYLRWSQQVHLPSAAHRSAQRTTHIYIFTIT